MRQNKSLAFVSSCVHPSRNASSVQTSYMIKSLSYNFNEIHLFGRYIKKASDFLNFTKSSFSNKSEIIDHKCFNLFNKSIFYYFYFTLSILFSNISYVFSRNILAGIISSIILKKKTIIEVHDINVFNSLHIKLINSFNSDKLLFLSISENLKKQLRKYFRKNKIFVLHDSVSKKFTSNTEPFSIWKKKKKLSFGFFGNQNKGKGFKKLIFLIKNIDNAEFHIIGFRYNEIINKNFKKIIDSAKSDVFFWGHVPHKSLIKYGNKFDIAIALYEKKSFGHNSESNITDVMSPLKIFEYASLKKLIILTKTISTAEIFNNEEVFFVNYNSDQSLINSILQIKKNITFNSNKAIRAYKKVKSHYTWEIRSKKIEKLFLNEF